MQNKPFSNERLNSQLSNIQACLKISNGNTQAALELISIMGLSESDMLELEAATNNKSHGVWNFRQIDTQPSTVPQRSFLSKVTGGLFKRRP